MTAYPDCPRCHGTGCEVEHCATCNHTMCVVCANCMCSECMARGDEEVNCERCGRFRDGRPRLCRECEKESEVIRG